MSTEPDNEPAEAPDEGEPTEETPAAAPEGDEAPHGGTEPSGEHPDEPEVDPEAQPVEET